MLVHLLRLSKIHRIAASEGKKIFLVPQKRPLSDANVLKILPFASLPKDASFSFAACRGISHLPACLKEAKSPLYLPKEEKGKIGISTAPAKKQRSRKDIPTVADFKDKGLNAFPDLNESIKDAMNKMPSNTQDLRNMVVSNIPSPDKIMNNAKQAMPDPSEVKGTPLPVFILTCTSLLPLLWPIWRFLGSGYILPGWEFMQMAYSACAISFLGGMRWGLILKGDSMEETLTPNWKNLSTGLTPLALAICGVLSNPFIGYPLMISGFAISAYIDLIHAGFPSWFKALRAGVTIGAIVLLLITFALKLILRRQPQDLDHRKSLTNNFT